MLFAAGSASRPKPRLGLPRSHPGDGDREPGSSRDRRGGSRGASPLTSEQRDAKVAITRDETAPMPTWRLSPRGGGAQDLFAEAPPGWYFETRKSSRPDEFLIVEVEKPRTDSRAFVPVISDVEE